jgi:hypothetical protein
MRYGLGLHDEPCERDGNLIKANSVQLRSSSHGQAPVPRTSPIRSMVDHEINFFSFGLDGRMQALSLPSYCLGWKTFDLILLVFEFKRPDGPQSLLRRL